MKRYILWLGMLLCNVPVFSQTYEEWLEQEKAQYNKLAEESEKGMRELQREYDDFLKKQDEEFVAFLKQRWTEYQITIGKKPAKAPEPKIAPSVSKQPEKKSIMLKSVVPPQSYEEDESAVAFRIRKMCQMNYTYQQVAVHFYGNQITLNPDKMLCQAFTGKLSEGAFADYWLKMSRSNYDDLLDILLDRKRQLGLNDWGYYMLLHTCAGYMVTNENTRELLTWFLLNKSGYAALIGYAGNAVSVLLPAVQEIYYTPFITRNGIRYYILRPLDKSLLTYDKDFAGSGRCPDLRLNCSLNFSSQRVKKRVVKYREREYPISYNSAVIDFYKDYPSTTLDVYFDAPASAVLKESVIERFQPLLEGLMPTEQLDVLLAVLHQAFPYKTDEEQFGREKYFFAEEMFAYPYSDCEDRAVLFSWLERTLTDMTAIGLSYAGHVASAVLLPGEPEGEYIKYQEECYTVCDPTYMGAKKGMCMPGYAGKSVEVIPLRSNGISFQREKLIDEIIRKAGGVVPHPEDNVVYGRNKEVFVTGFFDDKFSYGEKTLSAPVKNKMVFLAKINAKNSVDWVIPLGGTGINMPQKLKWNKGSLLLSGIFEGTGNFGSFRLRTNDKCDLFMTKIDLNGRVLWAAGAGLKQESEKSGYNYSIKFAANGKLLGCNLYPDIQTLPVPGILVTRRNEVVMTGDFNRWKGVSMAFAANKKAAAVVDPSKCLKELNEAQIQQKTDKAIAGLLAAFSMLTEYETSINGETIIKALNACNPSFQKRFPDIYKHMGKINTIRCEGGVIQIKTKNKETIVMGKIKIKNDSRLRALRVAGNNVKIEIIDGVEIGTSRYFPLNHVLLYRRTGDMLFNYDRDHTLRTYNMSRDILK